jgi:acetyltransferase EpsM
MIGGGEHARVLIEAARSQGDRWEILGFLDPLGCEETTRRLHVPRLGGDELAPELAKRDSHVGFIIAVARTGVSPVRREVASRYDAHSVRWHSVVHETAWISPTARLGRGVAVFAGARVNTGASIGDHGIVNTGAIVEHDVQLGAFTVVSPGATIGGGAVIDEETYLGLGCRIRDHLRIGKRVMVGMGAVVVDAVADGEVVAGVPARPLRTAR